MGELGERMIGVVLDRVAVAAAATAAASTFVAAFDDSTRLLVAVPVAAVLAVSPVPRWWRPVLAVLSGLAVAVLVLRQPVAAAALSHPDGWQRLGTVPAAGLGRTLRLTLPLPAELAVVPVLLAALAGAAGTALIQRRPGRLIALLPAAVVGAGGMIAAGVHETQSLPVLLGLAAAALLLVRGADGGWRTAAAVGAVALAATPLLALPLRPDRATVDLRDRVRTPVRVAAGADLLDRVAGWLSTPRREMFRAEGDPVRRWRLAVLDSYDGDTWTSSAPFTPAGLGVPPAGPGTGAAVVQRVRLAGLDGPYLPAADRPVRIGAPVSAVDTADGVLVVDGLLTAGTRYQVTSAPRPEPARPVRSPAAADTGPAVPTTLAPLLRTLLRDAPLRPAMLPGERAGAVESYLRGHRRNVTGAASAAGIPALEAFLTGRGPGTTVQFATAFALAMRSDGIPARLVVGFTPPPAAPAGTGPVIVYGRDARVWVELKYEQVGWVTYDPTPAPISAGSTAEPPPPSTPATVPTVVADPPPPPDPVDLRAPRATVPVLLGLLIVVLVYLAAVALTPIVRRRWWRRRAGTADERVVRAWHDVLREYGPAAGTVTPAGLRDVISGLPGGAVEANTVLAALAGRALYGPQSSVAADADVAWRSAGALRGVLRRARGRRERWLRMVHPARLIS